MKAATLLCFLPLVSAASRADVIQNFGLIGTTSEGVFTGTLRVDLTTGSVVNFEIENPGFDNNTIWKSNGFYADAGLPTSSASGLSSVSVSYTSTSPTAGRYVDYEFFLPVSSFVGYTGSTICSTQFPCDDASYILEGSMHTDPVISGSAALAPEPSSIALLGTGIVAVLGDARRRLRRW